MTWAMIKDKRKMRTMLDEIDEEIIERNEAEDVVNKIDEHKEEPSEPEDNSFRATEGE